MIFKKTFRYLLKPNQVQKQKLYNFAGGCRWLYNWGLERKKKAYEEEGKTLSYFDLNNALPKLKEETPWLKEIHSQALQQTLRDLSLGIDVGISTFATLAVGSQNSIDTIENPRFLEIE